MQGRLRSRPRRPQPAFPLLGEFMLTSIVLWPIGTGPSILHQYETTGKAKRKWSKSGGKQITQNSPRSGNIQTPRPNWTVLQSASQPASYPAIQPAVVDVSLLTIGLSAVLRTNEIQHFLLAIAWEIFTQVDLASLPVCPACPACLPACRSVGSVWAAAAAAHLKTKDFRFRLSVPFASWRSLEH